MTTYRTLICFALLFIGCPAPQKLSSAPLYIAETVGTLNYDWSEARSLNQKGNIAGKLKRDGKYYDFLWTKDKGLVEISDNPAYESYPIINNKDIVTGYLFEKGWFSVAINRYEFNGSLESIANEGASVQGFNDETFVLYSDHTSDGERKNSWYKNKNTNLLPTNQIGYALNNKNHILVSEMIESPGQSRLFIWDYPNMSEILVQSGEYYGIGLNDNWQVIAKNKEGTQSFFWEWPDIWIDLKPKYIPTSLNNFGATVGKLDDKVFLCYPEGIMIDLNEEGQVDFGELGVEKITAAWAINDKWQILVSAKFKGNSQTSQYEEDKVPPEQQQNVTGGNHPLILNLAIPH